MGKSSINGPLSMAMLNNQRVVTVCFNELHSMIPHLEKWPGQGKLSRS